MIGLGGGHMGPQGTLRSFGDHEAGKIQGRVLIRMMRFVKPYWKRLATAAVLMLATTGTALVIPLLTKRIIDVDIASKDIHKLLMTGLWLAVAMSISYFTQMGQSFLLTTLGQRVLYDLRNKLFEKLQALSVAYNDSHIVGVTVSRVINDVSVINNLLSSGLVTIIGDTILIVGTIVIMMAMDARLALLTFTIIPFMVLATVVFSKKAKSAFMDTRVKVAALVGNLAENIGSMRVIQSYAQEETSQKRFEENNWQNRMANVRAMILSYIFLPSIDVLSVGATCIVLLAGGILSVHGIVTIGTIVAFMTYVSRFFAPIRELSQLFNTLQTASAGGERVLEIIEATPLVVERPDAVALQSLKGRIDFKDVSFCYRKNVEVLHDLNFTIEPGETVAVVGPTGAGKTSITNLVCRFYDVTGGELLIDGYDIRDITLESLHGRMGYVSQDPFLFYGSIEENLCFGLEGIDKTRMVEAARNAEAHAFIERLPEGYATQVLEGGVNLSTGQRQLISIARALIVDPDILIMDEATSSVDTVTEGLIQKALAYLFKGRTSIVIAHRLTTIQGADRIYVLNDGRIIESGNHNELILSKGMYRNLYERQFIDEKSNTRVS